MDAMLYASGGGVFGDFDMLKLVLIFCLCHIYRGEDLDGASVGVAFIDSMCDQRSSVSLVQDRGGLASTIAAYAAHEVGHLFGMGHDTGATPI